MGLLAAYAVPHPPLIVPAVGQGQEEAIPETVAAYEEIARRDRKSTRLNSSHPLSSRMPSSA